MPRKELNVKNLTEGMVVKNYIKMCELLGQPVCSGQSKKCQIRTWERYFDYHKEGQKFIITQIYGEPLPENDGRKFRAGVYAKYIEVLLLRYLALNHDQIVGITKRQLFCLLGFVPTTYNGYSSAGIKSIQEKYNATHRQGIKRGDVECFCDSLEVKLNSVIEAALTSMKRKGLIDYTLQYMIVTNDDKHHVADATEIQLITQIHKSVLDGMGLATVSSAVTHRRIREFYHKCNLECQQYNWKRMYQRLYITYMPNAIKADTSVEVERLKTIKSSKIITSLNQAVAEGMYRKITSTYKKYNNEESKSKFVYTDEFADIQKRLVDYLVRLNAAEIKMVANRIDHKEEN